MKQQPFKPGHLQAGPLILRKSDTDLIRRHSTRWTAFKLGKTEVKLDWTKNGR